MVHLLILIIQSGFFLGQWLFCVEVMINFAYRVSSLLARFEERAPFGGVYLALLLFFVLLIVLVSFAIYTRPRCLWSFPVKCYV